MSDFWVFGYGSLMWRPGFAFLDATPARLNGWHRSLCVYSWVHRGTRQRPGLVLGLDRGGSCRGIAYRVPGSRREEVIAYLRGREMVTVVYRETWCPVRLVANRSRRVRALTYLVDRSSPQYAGRLHPEALFAHVSRAVGRSGANAEYVINTTRHLASLGIHDPVLEELTAALAAGPPSGGDRH
jgi:cation transport protein ChaC